MAATEPVPHMSDQTSAQRTGEKVELLLPGVVSEPMQNSPRALIPRALIRISGAGGEGDPDGLFEPAFGA